VINAIKAISESFKATIKSETQPCLISRGSHQHLDIFVSLASVRAAPLSDGIMSPSKEEVMMMM